MVRPPFLLIVAALAATASLAARFAHPPMAVEVAVYAAGQLPLLAVVLAVALRRPDERPAWLAVAAALAANGVANALVILRVTGVAAELVDPLYLVFGPLLLVAIVLLHRRRHGRLSGQVWLDGAIAVTAVAALAAALIYPVLSTLSGDLVLTATAAILYPAHDALLLALVAQIFLVRGRRPGRTWWLMAAALSVFLVADLASLVQATYAGATASPFVVAGWLVAPWLIAAAATVEPEPPAVLERWTLPAVPASAALVTLGVLAIDTHTYGTPVPRYVALGCGLLLVVRLAIGARETSRTIDATRRAADTDPLTGLANRRALMEDLEPALQRPGTTLALLDLDGFKAYNDTFGHPEGDALLVRFARRLDTLARADGRAYRLGGDEFCLLLHGRGSRTLAAAADALVEHRGTVLVTASFGSVRLGDEARDVASALRIADERLYAEKRARHRAAAAPPVTPAAQR